LCSVQLCRYQHCATCLLLLLTGADAERYNQTARLPADDRLPVRSGSQWLGRRCSGLRTNVAVIVRDQSAPRLAAGAETGGQEGTTDSRGSDQLPGGRVRGTLCSTEAADCRTSSGAGLRRSVDRHQLYARFHQPVSQIIDINTVIGTRGLVLRVLALPAL